MTISYLGTHYFGWQRTRSGPSIQEALETACSQICRENITCEAASRTDRGVHAAAQTVQFYTSKERSPEQLQKGLNALLPSDIRVIDVEYRDFHPTLDAIEKTYHYDLCFNPIQSPFYRHVSWHYPCKIDVSTMLKASKELIGTRDFSAFTTAKAKNPICTVSNIEFFSFDESRLRIAITGDRFLYKMARTLAGTLVYIGAGKLSSLNNANCRAHTGVTAPPHGLTLAMVRYRDDH